MVKLYELVGGNFMQIFTLLKSNFKHKKGTAFDKQSACYQKRCRGSISSIREGGRHNGTCQWGLGAMPS